jgi:tetratricopeptide (TPR) repeat protein
MAMKHTWTDPPDGEDGAARDVSKDTCPYFDRAIAFHEASQYDRAIAEFDKVLELNPSYSAAYLGRGNAHYEKAHQDAFDKLQLERAITDFKKAIELNPESALAYCHLGWAYQSVGNEPEAIASFRKALAFDPSLEAARDNLKLLGVVTKPEDVKRPAKPSARKS